MEKVIKSEDKSEILEMMIRSGNGRIMNYVGVYVPPMTNGWQKKEHEEMLVVVLKDLEKIVMESSDIVIVSDFDCKEINWEILTTTGSESSWSNRLLNWAVGNLMTQ